MPSKYVPWFDQKYFRDIYSRGALFSLARPSKQTAAKAAPSTVAPQPFFFRSRHNIYTAPFGGPRTPATPLDAFCIALPINSWPSEWKASKKCSAALSLWVKCGWIGGAMDPWIGEKSAINPNYLWPAKRWLWFNNIKDSATPMGCSFLTCRPISQPFFFLATFPQINELCVS